MHIGHEITLLLVQHGYTIVFIFTLFEGEMIVALAGFSAYLGHLKLPLVIVVAIIGAVAGDLGYFWLGRWKGQAFLSTRPYLRGKIARVHRWTEKYHDILIIASRFMYGFRTIIPFSFGASGISPLRYTALTIIGAALWAPIFACGGYLFGGAVESFIGHARRYEAIAVILALAIIVVTQSIAFIRRRKATSLENVETVNTGSKKEEKGLST